MNSGILTFAHNTEWDYLRMAKSLAIRASKFAHLPVTVVTDQVTLDTTGHTTGEFDSVIVVDQPDSNSKHKERWLNKGRWSAFELSPYDNTLVLDSDYIINSDRIVRFFEGDSDFGCFRRAKYLFVNRHNEFLSSHSFDTYWATGIRFKKTLRVSQIFEMIGKIENNYDYYGDLHGFMPYTFRNDYALTIALRTVNGQWARPEDFFVGSLVNVDSDVDITRIDETTYRFSRDIRVNGVQKKVYLQTTDFDFHVLNKQTCLGLTDE